ncbi:hypothetical protein NQP46_00705 [Streptomyces albus]|nr:hypothetical protein NQP46_00705 [Streptomyces albus]
MRPPAAQPPATPTADRSTRERHGTRKAHRGTAVPAAGSGGTARRGDRHRHGTLGLQTAGAVLRVRSPPRPAALRRTSTEELWGDRPPHHAANALQAHVARLRRLLSGTDTGAGGHAWISTLLTGYLLRSGCATTDIEQFHELSAQGRAAVFADPPEAVRL